MFSFLDILCSIFVFIFLMCLNAHLHFRELPVIVADFLSNLTSATALAQLKKVRMLRVADDNNGFHQYSLFLVEDQQPSIVFACPSCESMYRSNDVCMQCGFNII